jgi:maleylacetoacetate isomerase
MNDGSLKLYSYWRSSAAFRVRIALNLKRLDYQIIPVNLIQDGGEQHGNDYTAINPQELVPVLMHGQRVFRQSLAIIDYVDETWPDQPLMPTIARDRQRVRAIAQAIACDIHPLNNLRVMQYLASEFGADEAAREKWMRHWIAIGFAAIEKMLADNPSTGEFCEGDMPTMADCSLVPQVFNARRVGLDLAAYPVISRIERACMSLPAFDTAQPSKQPDAPAA